jgi:hypothetical protein
MAAILIFFNPRDYTNWPGGKILLKRPFHIGGAITGESGSKWLSIVSVLMILP